MQVVKVQRYVVGDFRYHDGTPASIERWGTEALEALADGCQKAHFRPFVSTLERVVHLPLKPDTGCECTRCRYGSVGFKVSVR